MNYSGTVAMMARQHGDRWSSFGEHSGIRSLASLLPAHELARIDLLQEFDHSFLHELSPDISIAVWNPAAVLFEAGSYLDLAFYVLQGAVEISLASNRETRQPVRPVREGTIVFLATLDLDLSSGASVVLGAGELFGEIGALNGWPQSVTARVLTESRLLQIRVPALRKLRRKSKRIKQRLDELYRSRALRQQLATTPVLENLDTDVIDGLADRVELISCQPGEAVTHEGKPVEHLILVRSGSLKMSQVVGNGEVVVSYVSKGATVGESELIVDENANWQVTTSSVGYSELVLIKRTDLLALARAHPVFEQRLWALSVSRIKDIGSRRNNFARADLLEFSLDKGITQANSVLVIDLERCTRCDDCIRACSSTHGGTARFVREGEAYDGFLVARSCYHCADPFCLVGCPTGAIRRINVGDVVEIDPAICIGCGACEQNCPFDAIVMRDLGKAWGPDAVPIHLRGEPRAVATKCDLCQTSPYGPACVSSCPHGAAHRVAGLEEFDVLVQAKRRRTFAE